MYRFLLTLFAGLTLVTATHAQQTATITAKLIDSLSRETQLGALVELTGISDPAQKFRAVSVSQGSVTLTGVPFGTYKLRVSFLGYTDLTRTLRVNTPQINLGTLSMQQDAKWLSQVEARGTALRTSQRGDTLTYNADAFKVTKDADAEGLLSKMPGVTVIDGQVEAQGETVKKVFVDGKEFFGNDVTSALRNLPAEIVQRVEVYNKLSDQAEFTGIDDGEGFKAINIVTHPDMRQGQFGKLYAGYGFDDKYIVGGSVNVFTGNHRISFIGLLNNLNQQNFSTEDILGVTGSSSSGRGGMQGRGGGRMRGRGDTGGFMVPQQAGVSTVGSFGVNYSAQWGRKVDFQGSYFFNTNKNENTRVNDRQYISRTDTLRFDNTTNISASRNYNNRINGRMEWKINDNQSLMIRPSLSFQSYSSGSSEDAWSNYFLGTENIIRTLTQQLSDSKSSGYNISNSILYRTKLGKPGRTLTLDGSFNFSRNDRTQTRRNEDFSGIPLLVVPDSIYGQYNLSESFGYRLQGSAIYTEPLTEKSQLSLQYRVSYNFSDADRKTFLWEVNENRFNPYFDETLSNIYNSGYTTHRVGPGYRLNNDKNRISMNVFYQYATLTGDQDYPLLAANNLSHSFNNVVYFGMWHHTFNPNNTLRLHVRSSTDNPSVSDLQDVVDVSNSRSVSVGNPGLSPSYSHSMFAHYIRSNTAKGRTFMLMGAVSLKNNSIVDSTMNVGRDGTKINGVDIASNARVTKPINMNGDWNARTMINFGFPMSWIKSNLNLFAGLTYAESPAMIDGEKNLSKGQYYSGGAVLGSNISEKIDFTIGYNGGYNIVRNTISASGGDNEYFSHSANLKFKWVMWGGFTLTGGTSYMQYKGITDDYDEQYTIIHLYLGKKLFRNQRGELMFGVNDLLDQNTSFSRNVTAQYIENVTNRVIGRYWGIQFNYNLRNFGKKSSRGNVNPESFVRSSSESGGVPPAGLPAGYGGYRGAPPAGGPGGPGAGL